MVKHHLNQIRIQNFKSCLVIIFGVLGFHYEHKGSMKTITILLYSISGFFNGYFTAKYYKYMGGKHWALNLITSSVFFPVIKEIIYIFNSKARRNFFINLKYKNGYKIFYYKS